MINSTHIVRLRILPTILFLALSSSAVFSQDARSPVGTWELAIARPQRDAKETGTVFLTFNTDKTLAGYGFTTGSFGVFTLTGTWDLDPGGRLKGNYTQVEFDNSLDATFVGRATAGKKLEMNAEGILGAFKYRGAPMGTLPDISGSWNSVVTRVGVKGRISEAYQFTNSVQFPGVFGIIGSGTNANRSFAISGMGIVTSKNEVTAITQNDFGGDELTGDFFTGKFRPGKHTIGLLGDEAAGIDPTIPVRARLSRP